MEYTANYKQIADLKVFDSEKDLSMALLDRFEALNTTSAEQNRKIKIALSGGSTPIRLFKEILPGFKKKVSPENFEFYWGDERCVSPCQPESNYGNMLEAFIAKSGIPDSNIFRMKGEEDPEKEKLRYAGLLEDFRKIEGYPSFDLIFLGLGDDGHTASIFPNRPDLLKTETWVETALNPQTLQQRITLTGRVLQAASELIFLVTGTSKSDVINEIFEDAKAARFYPAWHIRPYKGKLSWYCDREAAGKLVNRV